MEENNEKETITSAPEEEKSLGAMARIARMSTLKPEEIDDEEEYEDEEEYYEESDEYEEDFEEEDEEPDEDEEADDEESEDDESENEDTELAETESAEVEEKPKKKAEPLVHHGEILTLVSTPATEDMFRFMMRHSYFCVVGVLGLLISISAIVMLIVGYGRGNLLTTLLMVFVSLMFTVVNPVNIYMRAKKQTARADQPERRISYTISDAGIDMIRNGDYLSFKWEKILKVREGKTGFYVYLAPNQAFILPFRNFPENVDKMRDTIVRNINNTKKCKVKKVQ